MKRMIGCLCETIVIVARDAIDSRRLVVLAALRCSTSLTSAASKLGLSVSGLHYQLERLERELGFAVVRRVPTGLVLTEAGAVLEARVRYLYGEIEEAIAAARVVDAGSGAGPLRLGAPWPVVSAVVSRVLPELTAVCSWTLQVTVAFLDSAVGSLRRGGLDVVVAADWAGNVFVADDDVVVSELCAAHHLLAGAGRAAEAVGAMSTALEQRWVSLTGNTGEYLSQQFSLWGVRPQVIETDDVQEYRHLIDTGEAVGLVEPLVAAMTPPSTRLTVLGPAAPFRYFIAMPVHLSTDPRALWLTQALRRAATSAFENSEKVALSRTHDSPADSHM